MTGELTETVAMARIPGRQGVVRARISFDVPSRVKGLAVAVPGGTTVEDARGFTHGGDGQFRWDRSTASPTLVTTVQAGEPGARADSSTVDAGEWALVEAPRPAVRWQHRGPEPTYERRAVVDDEGVASATGALVFLGPHREWTKSAAGQKLRLVVPEAASMAASPRSVNDALMFVNRNLDVGARTDEVVAVAAPTEPARWGSGGQQSGANGFWARDTAALDRPNSTWLHEYVHTRQAFETAPETRWLLEATAVYYATTLAHRRGLIDHGEYHAALNTSHSAGGVLATPGRWQSIHVPYQKGSRVLAWLDGELRESGTSFEAVFAALNRREDPVDHAALERTVADALETDPSSSRFRSLAADLERYVTTTDVPPEAPPPRLEELPGGPPPDVELSATASDRLRSSLADASPAGGARPAGSDDDKTRSAARDGSVTVRGGDDATSHGEGDVLDGPDDSSVEVRHGGGDGAPGDARHSGPAGDAAETGPEGVCSFCESDLVDSEDTRCPACGWPVDW